MDIYMDIYGYIYLLYIYILNIYIIYIQVLYIHIKYKAHRAGAPPHAPQQIKVRS